MPCMSVWNVFISSQVANLAASVSVERLDKEPEFGKPDIDSQSRTSSNDFEDDLDRSSSREHLDSAMSKLGLEKQE